MRIVLNPAAFTRSMRACVTTGLPQAVSLGIPLVLASSAFPRFQPAPMSATSWVAFSWAMLSADAELVMHGGGSGQRQYAGQQGELHLPQGGFHNISRLRANRHAGLSKRFDDTRLPGMGSRWAAK